MRQSLSTQTHLMTSHCQLSNPMEEIPFTSMQLDASLFGYQVTSRSLDQFWKYSKWPDLIHYHLNWLIDMVTFLASQFRFY